MLDDRFTGNPRVELYALLKENYPTEKEALRFFASLNTKDATNLYNAVRKLWLGAQEDWKLFDADMKNGDPWGTASQG